MSKNDSPRQRSTHGLILVVLLALLVAVPCLPGTSRIAFAQPASVPVKGETVRSMGQPLKWQPYAGLMLDWGRQDDEELGAQLLAGLYRDLMNPNYGGLALVGEAYATTLEDFDGGGRIMGATRFFALQAGADYSIRKNEFDFVLSLTPGLRRGGVIGHGSYFRVDYYPGRDHSFSFGLQIPLGQPHMGKTRPHEPHVALPKTSNPEVPIYEPVPPTTTGNTPF